MPRTTARDAMINRKAARNPLTTARSVTLAVLRAVLAGSFVAGPFVPGLLSTGPFIAAPRFALQPIAAAQPPAAQPDAAPPDAAPPSTAPAAAAVAPKTPQFSAEQLRHFEQRVRPVLARHCGECHGPAKQESGLRLDSRDAVLRGADSGPVVLLGKPAESPLIAAVRRTGAIQMPPDGALEPADIQALETWIESGAPWTPGEPAAGDDTVARREAARRHWAFQPVVRPALPEVAADTWSRDPLDRFIRHSLAARQLPPSPEAARSTLLRRLAFNLTGLPPTLEQLADFIADDRPDSVERLVDKLLATPAYGERWARHWMDVARYSDTKGYVFFEDKNYTWAYTYRDYLIEAFNRDLPYDQFLLEQLAADKLPASRYDGLAEPADPRPLRALGFLTLSPHFMGNNHDIIDDRIDVATRGLLGLTVTCARCHDHKYDPVAQREYYGLYGVFRGSEEPTVPPLEAPAPDTDAYRGFSAELAKRRGALEAFVQRKHQALVDGARSRVAEYLLAAHASRGQPATDDFMLIADPNDLNPAMIARWRIYLEKSARRPDPVWRLWHRLAEIPETRFADEASAVIADELARAAQPSNASSTASSGSSGVRSDRAALNSRIAERFAGLRPRTVNEVAAAYAELLAGIDAAWRSAVETARRENRSPPSRLEDAASEELRRVLYGPDAPPDVPVLLGWGFLTLLPDRASQGEYQKLLKDVESHLISGAGAPPRALALRDSATPFDARVFLRGNPNRLGEPAPRQFLSAVNPGAAPFQEGSGRLELAREIARASNPLTARVMVNRLWLHHFGAGIVRTPGDFGLRGEPPTHPELLDYLAGEFVRDGWSMKTLHRRLATSAVFRQASGERPEPLAIDPENRLWWRMNARRLEFEPLRDAMLAVADSLDRRLGGPSINLLGDAVVPRRTLYGFIDRLDVPPLLTTFDFPSPAQSSPQRDQTTVPPQALFMMNNGFVGEVAKRVVQHPALSATPSPAARAQRLFELLYGRAATTSEQERVLAFAADPTVAAPWERIVHALLMANEFLFID
jgi:mono/diheme cytochrome c family protein